MNGVTQCAYMIPYAGGEVKCFLASGKKCKESCANILPIDRLPEIYASVDLIPQELLNLYVYDSIMQDVASNCHNLHMLIATYFDSLHPDCIYRGTAYRYTTKKKDSPRLNFFYNFSLTPNSYNGGSGRTQNQKLNHLWRVDVEGVDVEKFINFYCTPAFGVIFKHHPLVDNYVQGMQRMAETERTVIGRPLEEPEYLR